MAGESTTNTSGATTPLGRTQSLEYVSSRGRLPGEQGRRLLETVGHTLRGARGPAVWTASTHPTARASPTILHHRLHEHEQRADHERGQDPHEMWRCAPGDRRPLVESWLVSHCRSGATRWHRRAR